MSERKQIAIIAASPKPPGKAASDFLAKVTGEMLQGGQTDAHVINARQALTKKTTDEAFRTMAEADALIIIFPLYVFCLPGVTMRFLEMYRNYAATLPTRKRPGVYAVINSGFPEPDINEEAARVVHRFADAIGARFCYGVLIGGGGMVAANIYPARKLLEKYRETVVRMKTEIEHGNFTPAQSVQMRFRFPRRISFMMGNFGWGHMIKKNGKTRRDLRARPYQS